MRLETAFFGQSDFRFVDNFFQARETEKGKPIDGNRTDFANWRFVQSRPAAFFMN
jgi:hypothetical protein